MDTKDVYTEIESLAQRVANAQPNLDLKRVQRIFEDAVDQHSKADLPVFEPVYVPGTANQIDEYRSNHGGFRVKKVHDERTN